MAYDFSDREKVALGKAGKLQAYGNADEKVSPYLKAWVAQPDAQNTISSCVVGVIGEGTSRALQANWTSPFEQSNLGGIFQRAGGVIQTISGMTSVTTFSSTQVWEGNRPHALNLVLRFYALVDAKKEVADALRELEKMMGPNIEAGKPSGPEFTWDSLWEKIRSARPGGRIPLPVILCIGAKMIITDCVIESMTTDLSKERTKDGYPVRAEVNLSIGSKTMLNRDKIDQTWF